MPRPQKVALQRCFLFGSVPRGVEDAAPYKCKCRFFDKLMRPRRLAGALCIYLRSGSCNSGISSAEMTVSISSSFFTSCSGKRSRTRWMTVCR